MMDQEVFVTSHDVSDQSRGEERNKPIMRLVCVERRLRITQSLRK